MSALADFGKASFPNIGGKGVGHSCGAGKGFNFKAALGLG